jgi:hypothetical protein
MHDSAQSQSLIQSQWQGCQLHPFRFGDQLTKESLFPTRWAKLFLNIPHFKRQVRGMDTHWTRLIAGHAGKAAVHLLQQVRAERKLTFETFAGQCYSSAWGCYLTEMLSICGTDRQTQPTADAVQVLVFRGCLRLCGLSHGKPWLDDESWSPYPISLTFTGRFSRSDFPAA